MKNVAFLLISCFIVFLLIGPVAGLSQSNNLGENNGVLLEQHIEILVTPQDTIIEQFTFKAINLGSENISLNISHNFNLRNQIGRGQVRTPWRILSDNWSILEEVRIESNNLSQYDPLITIFEAELDAIERVDDGTFVLTSNAPIITIPNSRLGKNTYQIKIPKSKYWGLKKLQLHEINPPSGLLFEGGKYMVLQWLKPTQISKDKYLFNSYVKYSYTFNLMPLVWAFLGMLFGIFVQKTLGPYIPQIKLSRKKSDEE